MRIIYCSNQTISNKRFSRENLLTKPEKTNVIRLLIKYHHLKRRSYCANESSELYPPQAVPSFPRTPFATFHQRMQFSKYWFFSLHFPTREPFMTTFPTFGMRKNTFLWYEAVEYQVSCFQNRHWICAMLQLGYSKFVRCGGMQEINSSMYHARTLTRQFFS